jgi:hypothetical protein
MLGFLQQWSWFFGPLLSALVVVIGWFVAHRFNARRDRQNRAREKINGFLIEAYRSIEQACVRGSVNGTRFEEPFEKALADVQLLGSPKQVELARKIVSEIEAGSYSDPRLLLEDLRLQLRRDLSLAPLSSEIKHFRFKTAEAKLPSKT